MRFLLLVSLVNSSTVNSPDKVAAYLLATECASEPGKARCQTLGGTCMIESDGYYTVSAICVAIGAILLVAYIWPAARRLQSKLQRSHSMLVQLLNRCSGLPGSAWRVSLARKDWLNSLEFVVQVKLSPAKYYWRNVITNTSGMTPWISPQPHKH